MQKIIFSGFLNSNIKFLTDIKYVFKRIFNGFRPIFNFRIFNFSKSFENPVKILRDDPPTPPKASRTIKKKHDFLNLFETYVKHMV